MNPNIKCAEPYFPSEDIDWILDEIRVVLSGGELTKGPRAKVFEEEFARLTGVNHAIALSSGTQALELVLRYYQLEGGEVIVPTNTFLASANAVLLAGGQPVLADINPLSLALGVREIEAQLTPRTRGVIVVHIGGAICPEIDAIAELCKRRGLFLLEDASHAHGADWSGRRAGSFGDAAAFSLFPTKPMTTGEGGLVTTNDDALARYARLFRSHGTPEGKTSNDVLGTNYRMDEIRAVLGIAQTRSLERFLTARREVAATYARELCSLDGLQLVDYPAGMRSSHYKFVTILPTVDQRMLMAAALKAKHGIETGTLYWPPCHLQPVVRAKPEMYGLRMPLRAAEDVLPRVLCLPISANFDKKARSRVIEAVKQELAACQPEGRGPRAAAPKASASVTA